jgi:hypothetical protein
MSESNTVSIVIQAIAAIGTIVLAALAIWGDWIRAKLAPPKLTIEPHNLSGNVTSFTTGSRVIFYQLKVKNHRSWIPAKNCRVLLTQITKRGPDGSFIPLPMSVPMPIVWAPAELTPPIITLGKEQVLDLGFLEENTDKFTPRLYALPNDFKGFVHKDEAVRYFCEIVSDNYVSKKPTVVEVAWDGEWSDNLDQMSQHLVAKII